MDAWPEAEFAPSATAAEGFFLRLHEGRVDGCDFLLHHRLVKHLLLDDFTQARAVLDLAAVREPQLSSKVLTFSTAELGQDFPCYAEVFALNDLPSDRLRLTTPQPDAAERSRRWLDRLAPLLQLGAPKAHAELVAFRPLWLLAAVEAESLYGFGGYSSSLAWGSIALNADRSSCVELLIQAIHELAHQVLFALAVDVPLAFNDPAALYASPLRKDQRPMDGVLHACFVSARVYEVLSCFEQSPAWQSFTFEEQSCLRAEQKASAASVREALPTIEASAQLSALGERVVQAAKQAVHL